MKLLLSLCLFAFGYGQNIKWNDWGDWSDCDVTCGSGRRIKVRTCSSGDDDDCAGRKKKAQQCWAGRCPRKTRRPTPRPTYNPTDEPTPVPTEGPTYAPDECTASEKRKTCIRVRENKRFKCIWSNKTSLAWRIYAKRLKLGRKKNPKPTAPSCTPYQPTCDIEKNACYCATIKIPGQCKQSKLFCDWDNTTKTCSPQTEKTCADFHSPTPKNINRCNSMRGCAYFRYTKRCYNVETVFPCTDVTKINVCKSRKLKEACTWTSKVREGPYCKPVGSGGKFVKNPGETNP